MHSGQLKKSFKRVDTLRARLAEAEQTLNRDIRAYADANGLKIIPRKETLRANLP